MQVPSGRSSVLIVDDELDNLTLALAILEDHGLELATARDGWEGLAIAARLRPDLILLDIRMPGLHGFEVCRRLKAGPSTQEIPVIFLSALDQIEDKAQGFAAGGVDYVTKPFDARELLLRVTTHLRIGQRLTMLRAQSRPPASTLAEGMGADATGAGAAVAAASGARNVGTGTKVTEMRACGLPPLLVKALDLLLADLVNPPDPATLATLCHTNRAYLQGLFKAHLGLSVIAYAREQRLQRARSLLERGESGIERIAHEIGYRNGRDLSRAFKQRFGVPPTDLARATTAVSPGVAARRARRRPEDP